LGWLEAPPFKERTALEVAQFVHEDIICKFGLSHTLIVDGGTENKGKLQDLTDRFEMYHR
jgi:hypothetical protein